MLFKPVESLAERIAQHLAERIVTGELASRERIQELKVAAQLGVSRGSVREALLILQRWHLVDIIARRGALVTELSASHVDALYEIIESLYSMLAIKVAAVWEEDDLDPFVELFKRMRRLAMLGQTEEFFEASSEFPRLGYDMTDNMFLRLALEDLGPALRRVHFQALNARPDAVNSSLAHFGGILDGMLQRNSQSIEVAVHDFCAHHRDLALEAIGSS